MLTISVCLTLYFWLTFLKTLLIFPYRRIRTRRLSLLFASKPCMGSMLKLAKVAFELATDPDMYLFFEKGIRGGLSMILTDIQKLIINT